MTEPQLDQTVAETLVSIAIVERLLDLTLSSPHLNRLSERQIESLWGALRALDRHETPLRNASARIEASLCGEG